jgi:microsomal epoxide hydrolase
VKTLLLAILSAVCWPVWSENFTTSDGVRLHYIAQGAGETLLFVPGWMMPAEIWRPQIDHFARRYRVVALDPRSQGDSQVAASGNHIRRRAEDLHELIEHLQARRVVLVGWSLSVLEALLYVKTYGDDKLAALVLVDNSVGESPPQSGDATIRYEGGPRDRRREMATFVRALFNSAQPPQYLDWLTDQVMRTPPAASVSLLAAPNPRVSWRSIVYETRKPLFYAVTDSLKGQAGTLQRKREETWSEVFSGAGHALFIDQAPRFNASLDAFLGKALPQPPPEALPEALPEPLPDPSTLVE